MIISSGVCIFDNNRILSAREKFGDNILSRLFTDNELDYALKSVNWNQRLGARFAGKLAFFQAMNIQSRRYYKLIEIKKDTLGAPYINLSENLLEDFNKIGEVKLCLTLSHIKEYSIANVFLEKLSL